MMLNRIGTLKRIGLIDILGLIFLYVMVFVRGSLAGDPGLGWHLKTGEWIALNGAVPRFDPFLLTLSGKDWAAEQWLSDLLFWNIWSIGGWPLLHATVIVLALASFFFVLGPMLAQMELPRIAVVVTLLLATILGAVQWFIRPVVFSFLLFAIVYSLLQRKRGGLLLVPIFCLWANLHPGFVWGEVLLVLSLVVCAIESKTLWNSEIKHRFLVLVACFAATLVNPYGLALYRNIVSIAGSKFFMNLNSEWLSPDFHYQLFMPFALTLILLLGFAVARSNGSSSDKGVGLFEGLVLIVLTFSALSQRRNIPYFGIAVALPFVQLLTEWCARSRFPLHAPSLTRTIISVSKQDRQGTVCFLTACSSAALLFFVLITGRLPGGDSTRSDLPASYPHAALAQLKADGVKRRIFHTPDLGGFITWSTWPQLNPYIDDRNQLVPETMYHEFFEINGARERWAYLMDHYRFDAALLQLDSPLRLVLEKRSDWRERFRDEQGVLFVRN